MKKLASAALAVALCAITASANAQDGRFGEKGTLALHAATGSPMLSGGNTALSIGATPTLGFQTSTYGIGERCDRGTCVRTSTRVTSFYVNPRVHYFLIDNLSIGGEVLVATFSGTRIVEYTGGVVRREERDLVEAPTAFGILPLIGYNIALGERFSIWPHGGIGFRRVGYTDENNPADPTDDDKFANTWWFFNADVPFMLHIAPHFSIGAGPGISLTLSESVSTTSRGVTVTREGYSTTHIRWFNFHMVGHF